MQLRGLGAERIKRMRDQYARHIKSPQKLGIRCFEVSAKDVNAGGRLIDILATTDSVDLDREVVVPSGCDMAIYQLNKRNFLDHDYRFEKHVATMRSCVPWPSAKNFKGWRNRSQVLAGLHHPFADDLLTVAQQAGIAASIGFELLSGSPPMDTDPPAYHDAEYIVRTCSVIELSFTAMPCNMTCQSMDEAPGKDLEKRMGSLEDLAVKGRKQGGIALESAIALGLHYRKVHAVTAPKAASGPKAGRKRLTIDLRTLGERPVPKAVLPANPDPEQPGNC